MFRKSGWLGALVLVVLTTHVDAAPNLVVNPGFETGTFAGWTITGNTGFTSVAGTFGSVSPHGGSFQAAFGPIGSLGFLTQSTDIGTTPGNLYEVSFWLHNFGGTPNSFDATFAGTTGFSQLNDPGHPYTNYTFSVAATGALSTLQFSYRQDPSFWLLDDVSVTDLGPSAAVPEASALVVWSLIGLMGLTVGFVRRQIQS